MRLKLLAVVLSVVLPFHAATAEPPAQADQRPANELYSVAGGVGFIIGEDGHLQAYSRRQIPLDDGRALVREEDGKWHVRPADSSEVKEISLIDLAVYGNGDGFVGRRVRVTGRLSDAGVRSATIPLPGSAYLSVDLSSVPRDIVKRLIQQCGSLSPLPSCTAEVVGNIDPSSVPGRPKFSDVQIIWPAQPITR